MKKLAFLFAIALMMGACQNNSQNSDNGKEAADSTAKTVLVAYFSASEVRATERVAKNLAEATDADLFEIVTHHSW